MTGGTRFFVVRPVGWDRPVTKQRAHRSWYRPPEITGATQIMNLYSTLVSLHVLAAILGLGPLTVLAILSSSAAPVISMAWFASGCTAS